MKRLCLLFTLVIALLAMTSCDTNSPKGVADQVLSALVNEDYEKIVDLMGNLKGDALSKQESATMKAIVVNALSLGGNKLESYKIDDVTINDKGDKATVNYTAKYSNGKESNENMHFIKGSDGQWRFSLLPF